MNGAETIASILVPVLLFGAFWVYMIVNSVLKSRVRQLEIRERIAMIEKGLVPPPEVDPRGFDRAMSRYDRRYERDRNTSQRHRRAGITLIGVGLGLMTMIAFAGENPQAAVGVGGFIVLLGLAFVVNSLFEQRDPGNFAPSTPNGAPPGGSLPPSSDRASGL